MRSVLPLAVVLLLVIPATLQARLLVVTSGPTIAHVGDPSPVPADPALPPSVSVGYRYDTFSLFWVDFWTWDGGYCLYGGRMQPQPISAGQASILLGKDANELTTPFSYRYPPGLLVLAPVLLFGVFRLRRTMRALLSSRPRPVLTASAP